jgi:hypothetical protein
MDKGTEVGIVARELYSGGVDVSQNGVLYGRELFLATQKAIESGIHILYEAAFETLDKTMNFKADIFVRSERSTKLIEVKSSTSIKAPEHILDLAFQYYVLVRSNYVGPPIEVHLAYINKEYVRQDTFDVDQLFVLENVTQRIKDAQILISNYLRQFQPILQERSKCPSVNVSEACFKPYRCSFFDHCWKDMPPVTVFNISRLRKAKATQFVKEGILEPHQLPENTRLSIEQWIEVNASKSGRPVVNKSELKKFIKSLELDNPTFWMDFESFMLPIPELKNTRPYQQVCFQYCLLYRSEKGNTERREFLGERNRDPRRTFIKNLLKDTAGNGNIIVYNQSFEIARLRELAREFPEYAEQIDDRIIRIKDLLMPFSKKYYYHPLMRGSASIKAVLPVLVGSEEISYKNLAIQNGAMAMAMYEKFDRLSLIEQIQTRQALLEYCHLDCLAMIKVVDALIKIVTK